MSIYDKRVQKKEATTNKVLVLMTDNEVTYREKVIELANKGVPYRPDKCFKAMNIVLKDEKLKDYYFNSNDL